MSWLTKRREKTEKELQELKSKSTCNCKCIAEQTLAKTLINHAADISALAKSSVSVEPSSTEPHCAQQTSAQSLALIEYPSNVPYLAQSAPTNQILVTKKRADPPPFLTSTKVQSANFIVTASQEYRHKQGHLSSKNSEIPETADSGPGRFSIRIKSAKSQEKTGMAKIYIGGVAVYQQMI